MPREKGTSGARSGARDRKDTTSFGGGGGGQSDLGPRIEAAYYGLSGDRPNVRVRLADLREALPGVDRDRLDAGLMELERQGRAVLYPLDNPLEIGPRDRRAVLRTPVGAERHIIYLGGPPS